MASLSSFPFSIEGTAEVSASSKNRALATIGQRRPSKFVSLTMLRSWNDNLRRSIRAAARDSVGGEREKRSDDAFQHSIEKSQQVLAVQTELLQQIAEKRKLVASKKTGSSNAVERRGSTQDSKNSSPSNPNPRHSTSGANGGLSNEPFPDQVYDKNSGGGSVKGPPPPTRTVLDSHKSTKNSSSDNSLLDSGSVVKAEETSTLPTSLSMSSDTITPENVLEESMADILLSDTPEDMKPPPLAGPNVMNVILVAAECSPFSKTGGLGDVAGSLPKALARRGHRVMVVVPKYGDYPEAQHTGVVKKYKVDGQVIVMDPPPTRDPATLIVYRRRGK